MNLVIKVGITVTHEDKVLFEEETEIPFGILTKEIRGVQQSAKETIKNGVAKARTDVESGEVDVRGYVAIFKDDEELLKESATITVSVAATQGVAEAMAIIIRALTNQLFTTARKQLTADMIALTPLRRDAVK